MKNDFLWSKGVFLEKLVEEMAGLEHETYHEDLIESCSFQWENQRLSF